MSELRERMVQDLKLAGLVDATCEAYLRAARQLSMLTGCRPDTTGVADFSVRFRSVLPNVVTLPQHFKNNGYHAAAFGKIFHNDD